MADVYAHEAAMEQQEEHKRIHRPMKDFYNARPDLVAAHGAFPMFWRDLAGWSPYKEVFRAYSRWMEGGGATPNAGVGAGSNTSSTANGEAKATSAAPAAADAAAASSSSSSSSSSTAAAAGEGAEPGVRKKRGRWGEQAPAAPPDGAPAPAAGTGRRSRWTEEPSAAAAASSSSTLPPIPPITRTSTRWGTRAIPAVAAVLPPVASPAQEALFLYRVKLEELQLKLSLVPLRAKEAEADPNRSPSPPPEYDSTGKRLNSREQRMRKKLTDQRDSLLEKMMDLNPSLVVGNGGVPKFLRKLYIPWRDYPNYNFIGLVIGPRGNTQKKLEKETNCKISVRGRGSGKEGRLPSGASSSDTAAGRKRAEEDEDDLHVQVTGERLAEVEAAALLIDDLLHPVDDDTNEWKKQQLMELAAINGTLRSLNEPCSRCGEPGHRHYECPYAEAQAAAKKVGVRCAICGDGSHVTADCKMKPGATTGGDGGGAGDAGSAAAASAASMQAAATDQDYMRFMAEMGDETAKARLAEMEAIKQKAAAAAAAPAGGPSLSSSSSSSSAAPPPPPRRAAGPPPLGGPGGRPHAPPPPYQQLQQQQQQYPPHAYNGMPYGNAGGAYQPAAAAGGAAGAAAAAAAGDWYSLTPEQQHQAWAAAGWDPAYAQQAMMMGYGGGVLPEYYAQQQQQGYWQGGGGGGQGWGHGGGGGGGWGGGHGHGHGHGGGRR